MRCETFNPLWAFFLSGTFLVASGMLDKGAVAADPLHLTFPLECTMGGDCFVQNYVDHDPGPGFKDFHCGTMTYDGHDGTDFRIPSIKVQKQGVAVQSTP